MNAMRFETPNSLSGAVVAFLYIVTSVHAQTQPGQKAEDEPSAVTATQSGQAKIDPAKAADIRRLIEMTGAATPSPAIMANMSASIRSDMTNSLPPGEYRNKLIDLYVQTLSKVDWRATVDLMVPIYDRHLTRSEIKELIRSPQAASRPPIREALLQITGELHQIGREYGRKRGEKAMKEILEEHPDLAKALKEATEAQAK